jgi:polyhydroxyalkanoate synthesis regulator phasin
MQPGLTTVLSINTYQYQYINDKSNRLQYGFMAQELQQQIPSIVDEATNEEKSLAVDYGQMIPLLVKSIQEQQTQIDALKKEISDLKNR